MVEGNWCVISFLSDSSTGSHWSRKWIRKCSLSWDISVGFQYSILKSLLDSLTKSTRPGVFWVGRILTKVNFLSRRRTVNIIFKWLFWEKESAWGGGGKTENESQAGSTMSVQSSVRGSIPKNQEIMTCAKIGTRKQLCPRGSQCCFLFFVLVSWRCFSRNVYIESTLLP